jgi:HK97 family phage major capsid protein
LRPQTIIGRLPNLRRVPFNVRMPRQTAGGTYGWVGEGSAKPVGELAFDEITMRWAKAAGIIVITQELARQSSPDAEGIVRQDMIEGIGAFLDQQFTDPNVSEVSNVSPGAITNGVTNTVVAGGTSADAFRVDAGDLWASMLSNNIVPTSGAWLMSNVQAMRLSLMRNALDQQEFPGLTPTGGTLLGYPVITSQNVVAPDTDGDMIVFLNQSDVFLSEEGIMLDASSEASLQFNTTPDNPTSASTVMVSLWQRNMIGLRAERYINWKRRRDAAVGYIYASNYGVGS